MGYSAFRFSCTAYVRIALPSYRARNRLSGLKPTAFRFPSLLHPSVLWELAGTSQGKALPARPQVATA